MINNMEGVVGEENYTIQQCEYILPLVKISFGKVWIWKAGE